MFKVQDKAHLLFGYPKEVHHLPSLLIPDGFDGFRVRKDLIVDLQVRDEFIDSFKSFASIRVHSRSRSENHKLNYRNGLGLAGTIVRWPHSGCQFAWNVP